MAALRPPQGDAQAQAPPPATQEADRGLKRQLSANDLDGFVSELAPKDGAGSTKRKRVFMKEVKHMMYGFGDVHKPLKQTVEVMEDVVMEFIHDMVRRAMEVSGSNRIRTEDICFVIRKDAKKLARVQELLYMEKELRKARKAFEEDRFGDDPDA